VVGDDLVSAGAVGLDEDSLAGKTVLVVRWMRGIGQRWAGQRRDQGRCEQASGTESIQWFHASPS
jgi:hypothetical protein